MWRRSYRSSNTTSPNPNKRPRKNRAINKKSNAPIRSSWTVTKWMQNACVGMFICVCSQDVRMCLWERECEVWCHCLCPPLRLLTTARKKSISSFAPQDPNRTCFPDNRRPRTVFRRLWQSSHDSDISGVSLSVMNGCDGSILQHRRVASVTLRGQMLSNYRHITHKSRWLICN